MRQWTEDGYLRAARFAARAHGRQTLPGSELPYVLHVTSVAMEVMAALRVEPDHDQELAMQCALLHDVVEDTAVALDEIRAAFGPAVAEGVSALSKDPALPKSEQLADSLERIRRQPHEVWMVKLADRITNLQTPPAHWSAEKIATYREEAIQIHGSLGASSPALASRILRKIEAYGGFERKIE
jgi:(p)ppGpp synthase/HD superfamily hydrolase